MEDKYKDCKWVLIRNGEVRNIFNNRKEAVKHLNKLLKQTIKDFHKQDKNNDYDYKILIPSIEIKPIEERPSYLGI